MKIIYKNLFNEKCKDTILDNSSNNILTHKYVIDISNKEVQNIIEEFNRIIYKKLKVINEIKRDPVRTFFNLLFYDRKKFISTIKERLRW